jgi:DnaJ-class molecular chaperone
VSNGQAADPPCEKCGGTGRIEYDYIGTRPTPVGDEEGRVCQSARICTDCWSLHPHVTVIANPDARCPFCDGARTLLIEGSERRCHHCNGTGNW